ncbi:DUF4252 domain-containing protein [Zunongwangia endophytica]|uniref:DUF4252 domain-containing protein n=2 Tax=Zunongwangia endophytica TaxID=1808945 RepID=A0ABV8HAC6_9FLAO|nr:DUF4252 domain-containing protein [Zunongwangia endophytica]MDN3593880.1 DUF4252 domain-containing protein [Zunongwangia endophytica]
MIIAIMVAPFLAQSQDFAKYENMKDVDAMVMTSKMFKMLSKVDLSKGDPEAKKYMDMIENLSEIRLYKSNSTSIRNQMSKDFDSYLSTGSLDELMRIKESGKNIKFYSKSDGKNDDIVKELLMFMDGDEDGEPISVILRITGKIDITQLSKLTSDLNVPGADQLKNAKSKN